MPRPRRRPRGQPRNLEKLRHRKGPPVMRRAFLIFLSAILFGATALAAGKSAFDFEASVVQIEITRKQFDYMQPWTRQVGQVTKFGAFIGSHEILTSAEFLHDLTLLRLQKG